MRGRILPAHFFCRNAFDQDIGETLFARLDELLMNWQSAVERTVTGLGYELVDTERTPGGLLRVFIDKVHVARPLPEQADEFITVDDCEKVTRQLQHVLEVEGCAYERLEVSSPGLDRPLKKPADYARFVGEQIALTLKVAFQGRKKYQGELRAADSGWRIVYAEGKTETAMDFSLDEVREARLVPVLDFKGRRFSKPLDAAPGTTASEAPGNTVDDTARPGGTRSDDGVDGGRIQ
jgi:ribosome maturation factor RimP